MIQVNNLSKTYNAGIQVLNITNLDIPKGQSFGLVGNNGAGLQVPSFNTIKNMQNFDNFRELEVSNSNLSFRNDQMSRELNRLIKEMKEKNIK